MTKAPRPGKRLVWLFLCVVLFAVMAAPVWAAADIAKADDDAQAKDAMKSDDTANSYHVAGAIHTLVTADGTEVTETSLNASLGDTYIDEKDHLYVVTAIVGDKVIVRDTGTADMPDVTDVLTAMEKADKRAAAVGLWPTLSRIPARVWHNLSLAVGGSKVDVGIYQTHNDESYVPTSGQESKENGDIQQVGKTMKADFEKKGFKVDWTDTSHLPHDGQAYLRSRRTAAKMIRERPKTVLDVHRDAIPRKSAYATQVNGEPMSKVRLVVGRQNQNRAANLEYAKRIKAIADKKYPGLIKGIFHAKGNYNQDLGPRMILLEYGTHLTSLKDAERSVQPMVDVISAAAGMTPGTGGGRNVNSAGGGTAIWIIVIAALGGLGWFFLNKEGGFAGLRGLLGQDGQGEDGDDEN